MRVIAMSNYMTLSQLSVLHSGNAATNKMATITIG